MPFLAIASMSRRNTGWIDHSAFLAEGSRQTREIAMTKEQLFERLDEKLGTLRKVGLDVDLAQGLKSTTSVRVSIGTASRCSWTWIPAARRFKPAAGVRRIISAV